MEILLFIVGILKALIISFIIILLIREILRMIYHIYNYLFLMNKKEKKKGFIKSFKIFDLDNTLIYRILFKK